MIRLLLILVMAFAYYGVAEQGKITLLVKVFDEDLKPVPNAEIAFNDLGFFAVNSKGTAVIEINKSDLPVKAIRVKDKTFEAASWNLVKGTIEIIIRHVRARIMHLSARFPDGTVLANVAVLYHGSTTHNVKTDQSGKADLSLPVGEQIQTAAQFEIANVIVTGISLEDNSVSLTVDRPKQKQIATDQAKTETKPVAPTFDVSRLDSIKSIAAFYAVFRNIPISSLPQDVRITIDDKFKQLVAQHRDSVIATHQLYIRNISDTSMVLEDLRSLLKQASSESTTLRRNRAEFENKIVVITSKLQRGVANLSEEEKNSLRRDIDALEQLLLENESHFYENHNDYREIINTLREKYLDVEQLQSRLSETERLRLEETREFRDRLFVIGSIVIAFGLLIILLVSFSTRLRRQKKSLQIANERIEQINENLEDIVARRTRLLEEANKELDIFLYRASHDLRSPVQSLNGISQIVDHIDRQEMVQHVRLATDSMNRILNKLVDISEISQEATNIKSVNVGEMISRIRSNHLVTHDITNPRSKHAVTVRNRHVEFVVECADNTIVHTSASLLEIIIDNLVDNAIFFGGLKTSDEPVVVEIYARVNNDKFELTVRDNGVGIAHELRPRIFEMFFSGNVGSKGSGLGLYAVKKCVVALHGTVDFESRENEFTRFTVVIPSAQKPL